MKLLLLCAVLLCAGTTFSQRATLQDDVLTYKDRKFTIGDTLRVQYGSGQDGKFVFIQFGNMLSPTPLEASGSNAIALVDKIYKSGGRILMRAKVIEGQKGGKLFIEPEGSIDKKEIQ